MLPGQVFLWRTTKVTGRESREKFHIYVGRNKDQKEMFLFVNSNQLFDSDFELKQSKNTFLTKPVSYVSIGLAPVSYKPEELPNPFPAALARLSNEVRWGLADHIEAHGVIETRYMRIICDALKAS